ncbi:dioxygenase family protein [Micromonosporaceae bacterium Da 78-11]
MATDHDMGLSRDLPMLRRRRMLGLVGGTTVAALAAAGLASPADAAVRPILQETAGPYPGDGSNGPNVMTTSGIVRSDIRKSFGKATGVAAGIPLTVKLKLVHASTGKPAAGLAVYLWHCNRDGLYSLYGKGLTSANYLRGVQASGATGWVSFTSIFPACYSGRWPHIHFEVYPGIAEATDVKNKLRTSQIALPADVCAKVFATTGYGASKKNMAQANLATDNVFADGYTQEMASVTGSVAKGFTAAITVGV